MLTDEPSNDVNEEYADNWRRIEYYASLWKIAFGKAADMSAFAIRNAIIINGAAAIAILALAGGLGPEFPSRAFFSEIAWAAGAFAGGAIFGAIAALLAYISLRLYTDEISTLAETESTAESVGYGRINPSNVLSWLVIILVVLSFVFFIFGILKSFVAIELIVPNQFSTSHL